MAYCTTAFFEYDSRRRRNRMKFAFFGLLTAIIAVFLVIAPVSAHHAIAAKFDTTKSVTVRGIITGVDWANPHVHIFLNVREGNATNVWAAELESPLDLQKAGWSRDTV